MLLRLSCPPTDWTRLGFALEAEGSPTLAGIVRAMLATAPRSDEATPIALAFTPQQAGAVQRVAAGLGLELPATPVAADPDPAGWAAGPAERAEAVAAAEAIVRAHQRQRTGRAVPTCRPSRRGDAPCNGS